MPQRNHYLTSSQESYTVADTDPWYVRREEIQDVVKDLRAQSTAVAIMSEQIQTMRRQVDRMNTSLYDELQQQFVTLLAEHKGLQREHDELEKALRDDLARKANKGQQWLVVVVTMIGSFLLGLFSHLLKK